MIYLLIFIALFLAELFYFKIADQFNIIDKPNERSSHNAVTLRGGGVIYWIAALAYLLRSFNFNSVLFFTAISFAAIISFWDDLKGVNPQRRILFHLLAMSILFYMAGIFFNFPWWAILLGYIVFIGIVNAYNFMDGINGMNGLYSIAVLASLQYVNIYKQPFTNPDLIWLPIIASVVFLFFNFREKAKCFAGDVGSVTIAFWIVTLILLLIIKTQNLIWIGFLIVYGVDTVGTILHRIFLKQNIFQAHRLHFYQILANEQGMDHRLVSLIYFIIQLACSWTIIQFFPKIGWNIFIILLVLLTGTYYFKFRLMPESCTSC